MTRQDSYLARFRDRASQAVRWEPMRDAVKVCARQAARSRGQYLVRTGRVPEVAMILLASSPKAGSQWSKAVFDHPIVRRHTGLFTYPQLDYQALKPRSFPAGVLVPGLYVGYDHYLRMPKRYSFRTVYVFRDPREIIVSAYFSAKGTHRVMGDLGTIRNHLHDLSVGDGLLHLMPMLGFRLKEVDSWVGVQDPEVLVCRLEEISEDPRSNVLRILDHCGVSLSSDEFETVLDETSRASLQKKDLAARSAGSESHYRIQRKSYVDLFDQRHYDLLEEIVPGLIARLHYPPQPAGIRIAGS